MDTQPVDIPQDQAFIHRVSAFVAVEVELRDGSRRWYRIPLHRFRALGLKPSAVVPVGQLQDFEITAWSKM